MEDRRRRMEGRNMCGRKQPNFLLMDRSPEPETCCWTLKTRQIEVLNLAFCPGRALVLWAGRWTGGRGMTCAGTQWQRPQWWQVAVWGSVWHGLHLWDICSCHYCNRHVHSSPNNRRGHSLGRALQTGRRAGLPIILQLHYWKEKNSERRKAVNHYYWQNARQAGWLKSYYW